MSRKAAGRTDPLEVALLAAFRRNPPDAKAMIVNLTIRSADIFHKELEDAIALIDGQGLAAGGAH